MKRFALVALSLAAFAAVTPVAHAMDKKEVEQIVKNYISENPKAIIDALEKYQRQQNEEVAKAAEVAVKTNQAWLFDTKLHPNVGNAKGVQLVEFFDYNCGYCKHAFPDIKRLLDEDKNLNVVLIDMPILGPSSLEAAKWALAANKQGKYFEYHAALMDHKGPKDEDVLKTLAERAGLNVEKLKKDKDSADVAKMLDDNIAKANALGLSGTPAFVTKADVIRGYVGYDGLKEALKKARDKK